MIKESKASREGQSDPSLVTMFATLQHDGLLKRQTDVVSRVITSWFVRTLAAPW